MTEPNSEPKAASGPKRFVIKYAEQSSEDQEQRETSSGDDSDE